MYLMGAPKVYRGSLPPGRQGTAVTLEIMRRLAQQGAVDPMVRDTAVNVIREAGVPGGDFPGEVAALFNYVRDRIHYVRDPHNAELLQSPANTIRFGYGDCDDKTTLLCALLLAIGNRARVVMRAIATGGREFSHVFPLVEVGGRLLALDATYQGTPLGWQHPAQSARMDLAL